MFGSHNQAIADACLSEQLVSEESMQRLLNEARSDRLPLSELLVDKRIVSRERLLDTIARYLGYERLIDPPYDLPQELVTLIEPRLARLHHVVPVFANESLIKIIGADPFDSRVVDDLVFATGKDVRMLVADPKVVDELVTVFYRPKAADYTGILDAFEAPIQEDDQLLTPADLLNMAGETSIIRFVNLVLAQAIKDKASDIHFEPFEKEFKIRYRIDGALYEMSPPPRELAIPIISRIKVIGNLNIAERRVPQDGKVRVTVGGRSVDLRVSTLPTQFGESVVLRVLDQSATSLELTSIGMPDDVRRAVEQATDRPNGIFVSTGPTGSGKTTTLYSCLKRLNRVGAKLMTAEDPIEYEIEGIMQVAIQPHIGFTFAQALKAFLRQDPDIIMVGEIRDLETAQIAIQASLTGHLVLSTLHTNDAAGAVTRLMDMGIEPFLIASSLEAVLAQRLLRCVCANCRRSYAPSESLLAQLGLEPSILMEKELYNGLGCVECSNTGYRGRMGIFEMLEVTEPVRELIGAGKPAVNIREQALLQGMRTLRDDGLRGIFAGRTTVEEVVRFT